MRDRAARKKEEKSILVEVFLGGAKTEQEIILGYRYMQLVENSLEVMKMKSLMVRGSRGSGKKATLDILDNLLDFEIKERYELGLMPLTEVKFSEIDSVGYCYQFRHTIKTKDGSVRKGYKTEVDADNDEVALTNLNYALRRKGYTLVSVEKKNRSVSLIRTKNGGVHQKYRVTLIDDRV